MRTVKVNFDATHVANVNYQFDRSSCDCDSICRCGRITDARVESVPMSLRLFTFMSVDESKKVKKGPRYDLSEIEQYCVDRLMRVHKVYDLCLYTVNVCGGYYGEEIDSVSFENERDLVLDVQRMLNMKTDVEKIKFVLICEYSYVLDRLEDCTKVSIENVNPKSLLKNNDYASRVKTKKEPYQFLAECNIVGVVHNGRLIDGYNRLSSLDLNKKHKYVVLS